MTGNAFEIDRVGYDVQADEESKTQTVMDMLRKVATSELSYRFGKLKASVKNTETTIENSDEVDGIIKGK